MKYSMQDFLPTETTDHNNSDLDQELFDELLDLDVESVGASIKLVMYS